MNYEPVILILFIIASLVGVATRKLNIPYTVSLITVGLILGFVHLLHPPHLTKELLYTIFLPPLIFEAAIHLKSDEIKKDIIPIVMLVVPGVIVAIMVTAAVVVIVSGLLTQIHALSWPVGILFGAAIAATDPVSVVATFKQLGAPRRLRLLIESESLLNDGTAIVAFIIAMSFIQGHLGSANEAVIDFFKVVGLGLLVGVIVGVLTAALMHQTDDAMITITLTTVAAYGSFLIADNMGVSGVMSTVAAGLVCGKIGFLDNLFPSIRISTEIFWEYLSFAMNSLIFLLMGFAINLTMLYRLWPVVVIAYVAVLLARIFIVMGTWGILLPFKMRFPLSWSSVLVWGGMRGALSMVLALSIPDSFAMKNVIVTIVFGVVLISIFLQGLTISPIMRLFGLVSPVSGLKNYELAKAQISILQNSIEMLNKLISQHTISKKTADMLKDELQSKLTAVQQDSITLEPTSDVLILEEMLRIKRRIILEQKKSLLDMYQNATISTEVYDTLRDEFDKKLFELENMGA